jgi:hypothetical protein
MRNRGSKKGWYWQIYLGYRVFKGIANQTAKNSYRPDLRAPAVSRASAIQGSQRAKKETPEKKLRGSKAKKAEKAWLSLTERGWAFKSESTVETQYEKHLRHNWIASTVSSFPELIILAWHSGCKDRLNSAEFYWTLLVCRHILDMVWWYGPPGIPRTHPYIVTEHVEAIDEK